MNSAYGFCPVTYALTLGRCPARAAAPPPSAGWAGSARRAHVGVPRSAVLESERHDATPGGPASGGASANASRMRSRSSCGVRPEVSMIRSASPRRLSIIRRSLRMPSTTRSAGRQRMAAARRLVAVHQVLVGRLQEHDPVRRSAAPSAPRAPCDSSPKNTPPRASTTMATRAGPPGRDAELGHLAEQRRRQVVDHEVARGPRGECAASDRPAPDSPVMIVKPGAGRGLAGARGSAVGLHALAAWPPAAHAGPPRRPATGPCSWSWTARASSGPMPGVAAISSDVGGTQPGERPEPLQQRLLARRAHAGDVVERRGQRALRALLAVIGDGEPVRLVAEVLQHEQRLGASRDQERLGLVGEVDLLEALGEPDVRDLQAQVGQDLRRHRQLAAAAVHHHERGWVGEPPRPGWGLPPAPSAGA